MRFSLTTCACCTIFLLHASGISKNTYSMKTYVLLHFKHKNDVTIIIKLHCCNMLHGVVLHLSGISKNTYSMKTYVLLHFKHKNDVTIIIKLHCCNMLHGVVLHSSGISKTLTPWKPMFYYILSIKMTSQSLSNFTVATCCMVLCCIRLVYQKTVTPWKPMFYYILNIKMTSQSLSNLTCGW